MGQATSLVDLQAASTIKIRDPKGNILQDGDPGVQVLEQDGCTSIYVDIPTVYTAVPNAPAATWEIILEGIGSSTLRAVAASGLHLDYSGPQVLNGGRDAPLRAVLRTDPSTAAVDPASVQFFLNRAATGQVREIDLFDDGQHGDGEAGDGLYGGRVRVPRGLWYLGARGELGDGSEFRRLHDIPLRVKGFAGARSRNGQELAGTSRTIQFAITNDSSAARAQVTNQVYELGLDSSLGWATAVDLPSVATLAPGETRVFTAQVNVPADAAAGEVEETTLLVLEAGDLAASEILSVVTTVVAEKTVLLPLAIGP